MIKKITIILSIFILLNSHILAEKQVPNFTLTDINGNLHTNTSTQGKYLVVNFWATWCTPCLKEIPDFVEFYERHNDQVEILGLNYEGASKSAIMEFTNTFLVNYPIILFDSENSVQFKKFGEILGMPTTYIYDPKGQLIDYHMGEIDMSILEKSIIPKS